MLLWASESIFRVARLQSAAGSLSQFPDRSVSSPPTVCRLSFSAFGRRAQIVTMSSKSAPSDKDLVSGVSNLSIRPAKTKKTTAKAKSEKEEVADSWEEEDVSSDSDTETQTEWHRAKASEGDKQGISAPPPTPSSPPPYDRKAYDQAPATISAHRTAPELPSSSSSRPEKTDAVARRMIAGALGLKVAKLTDEQKAYQTAIKDRERKRRDEQKAAEKAREEEAAKARAAIWED